MTDPREHPASDDPNSGSAPTSGDLDAPNPIDLAASESLDLGGTDRDHDGSGAELDAGLDVAAVAARRAEFADVRARLQAESEPVDAVERDSAIAAALEQFSVAGADPTPSGTDHDASAAVDQLAERRASAPARRGGSGAKFGLVAAALVLVAAVGVFASLGDSFSSGSSDSGEALTTAPEGVEGDRSAGDAAASDDAPWDQAAEAPAAPTSPPLTTIAPVPEATLNSRIMPVDLGSFPSLDELPLSSDELGQLLSRRSSDGAAFDLADGIEPCGDVLSTSQFEVLASAIIAGRPVLIVHDPVAVQQVVLDRVDCTELRRG